jgi:hypothetical protein
MPQQQDAPGTTRFMGGPLITTADWSHLFNRGGPAAPAANVPARNAQPVSGVLAKPPQGGAAPWWMGPFQQGRQPLGPSAYDRQRLIEEAKARSGYQ